MNGWNKFGDEVFICRAGSLNIGRGTTRKYEKRWILSLQLNVAPSLSPFSGSSAQTSGAVVNGKH